MPQNRTMKSIYLELGKGNTSSHVFVENNKHVPDVGKNNILLEVKACSISTHNDKVLRDLFKKSGKTKFAVGQDVAGIVRQVGSDVATIQKGDEVVGIIPLDYDVSGCAEFVSLNEFDVVKKPDSVNFVDAAGCIGDAVKAYTALHYLGRMCSGDTVLVLDGASSFGSLAVQLASHWGAKVMATSATEDEKLYLQSLEPEIAQIIEMNQKNANLKSACMLETGNLGMDIIVDQGVSQYPMNHNIFSVSNHTVLPSKHDIISSLAVGGRWVTSKSNLQLDPPNSRLLYLKCASLGFLFEQAWMLSSAQQGRYQHILMDIMEKVSCKTIRPNIHHTVSFEAVPETLKSLREVRVGKVVMTF